MKEDEINNNKALSKAYDNIDELHESINQVIKRTADIQVAEEFTFSKFMLSDKLLKSLNKLNFIKPSPIQLKVIPLAKCGLDMMIQAKSGTGKTLAFAICMLENYDVELKFPQFLVIVPTREIAVQIVGVLNELGCNVKHFRAYEFIGGTDVSNDRKKIQSAKVVVGTPGRILHLINSEIFNIGNLETLVLDEADKLLEGGQMGKDVTLILNAMPKKIQIIAATATVTNHLEKMMKHTMKNPIGITPKHEIPVLLGIKQFVKTIPRENDNILLMNAKIDELQKIFTRIAFKQCLLFTDSQTKTQSYGNYLKKRGWKNEVINGSQDQAQRLDVLEKLNKFKCRILISTDLMARGIDIENINLVINLDLPYDCFTYLHRIGRAGRFGTHGIAITLVNGEEDLLKYQKMLGDIGGDSLKAMKFPDESTPYDFWNFEQKDGKILESIAGFAKDSDTDNDYKEHPHNGVSNGSSTAAFNQAEETLKNNLALLEITKILVDDKSKETKSFDLNAIIEDYEKSFSEPKETNGDQVKSTTLYAEDENIFFKAIEDLKLCEGDQKPLFEENQQRHIIFNRTNFDVDDDLSIPESSSSESEDVESTESDYEEDDEHVEEDPGSSVSANQKYSNYHNYVGSHYSQWENIYKFQLAHIQNYYFLQSSQK